MKKKVVSKKIEAEAEVLVPEPPSEESLDFDPISLLIAPMTESSFLERFYEKQPLYLKANQERKAFSDGLFDLETLCVVAIDRDLDEDNDEIDEDEEDGGPLLFSHDLTAKKYVDGQVVVANGDEFAHEVTLRSLHNQGYTFQVRQPQRFSDDLWLLVSALERRFQCLVGTNCYITPPNSQGLAPHHDDVELFILQTQGSKTWKVYSPLDGFQLPNKHSRDFDESEIGDPIMEVTLSVGDMLYLPRGFIHQAVSSKTGSAHVTISSFQGWSFANLAEASLSVAASIQEEDAAALPVSLRSTLPWNYLSKVGLLAELSQGPSGRNSNNPGHVERQAIATRLASGLRDLADQIESAPSGLLAAASDGFLCDFAKHRICPHPDLIPNAGEAPSSLDDYIVGRGEGLFALIPIDGPKDLEVPEGFVKIATPLMNSRAFHMLPNPDDMEDEDDEEDEEEEEEGEEGEDEEDEEEEEDHVYGPDCHHHHDHDEEDDEDADDDSGLFGPVVPAAYAPLISKILSTCAAPGLQLRSLVALAPHKDEEEVLRLAYSLWDDGFISTLTPPAAPAPREKKAAKKKESATAKVKEPAAAAKTEEVKKGKSNKRSAQKIEEKKPNAAKKAKK